MSLLLCRNCAARPFYIEKADLRIYSLQELCFIIYNYPLIITDDFISEELVSWIRNELSMGRLSERIKRLLEAEESQENILYLMLREGNYYNIDEINALKQRFVKFKNLPEERLLQATASTYFKLKRFAEACDIFAEIDRKLRDRIKKAKTEERNELFSKLSDTVCDEAVCKLRLFDDEGAKKLLIEGAEMAENSKCGKYLFLLDEKSGAKYVADEEKAKLRELREEARKKAMLGEGYKRVTDIFEKDSIKRDEEIKKLISEWKSVYRKMV